MEATEPTYDELVAAREARWEKARDVQRREWDAQRFMDRDADRSLHGVWVVYAWVPDSAIEPSPDAPKKEYTAWKKRGGLTSIEDFEVGHWTLVGFRRRRRRRKPQSLNKFFAKARRRLEVDKQMHVMVLDLHEARLRARRGDDTWLYEPPAFQPRRVKPKNVKPPLIVTTKWKRRAPIRAARVTKKITRFVAMARNRWERTTDYLFLGPLKSTQRAKATHEAHKLFPIYNELLVLSIDELSVPLQRAMFRAKTVRAGVSRIVWPEVPPTFEETWHRFLRWMERQLNLGREFTEQEIDALVLIEMALRLEWAVQGNPWLTVQWMRKALKKTKPSFVGDVSCGARKAKRKPTKRQRMKSAKRVARKTLRLRKASAASSVNRKRKSSVSKKLLRSASRPTKRSRKTSASQRATRRPKKRRRRSSR